MNPLRLGASLYVPATRSDLTAVANGERHPRLRSVVFCLEDAVRPGDVGAALDALAASLVEWAPSRILRFVRPRNPDVLRRLLSLPSAAAIDGFVLPKLHRRTLPAWWNALGDHPGYLMPTLETREVFDPSEMHALRRMLSRREVRERVLSLRIGGNDLLQCLGVRRSPDATIYETALGSVIASLTTTFRPFGFNLTGPVFEGLSGFDLLRREVALDLAHGLFGKSAIHPAQVSVIEDAYAVSPEDHDAAERILDPDAPAVFRLGEAMCEPATHRRWAEVVRGRAALYGVAGPQPIRDPAPTSSPLAPSRAPPASPTETSPTETSPAETSSAETSPAETSPAETSPTTIAPCTGATIKPARGRGTSEGVALPSAIWTAQ